MTAQADPYVRVYYRIIDDPKFEAVFDDKANLGWWLTLLLGADATYPAPANLPRRLPHKHLDTLVDAGLIVLVGGDRYRVHGLKSERELRSQVGKAGANARWSQSDRNANALPTHSERNAKASDPAMHSEPLRTSPIQSEPSQSVPTPAGAEKNGSKNRETDEERLIAYRAALANPDGHPAWYLDAAKTAVEVYEAQRRAN